METYIVEITDDALADMEAIYQHIAINLRSPENAMGQYNRIADAIQSLDTLPSRYSPFYSEPEHSLGIRKMVVDNYVVCYVVDPGIVTVTDVIYGAADIHRRLQERHK